MKSCLFTALAIACSILAQSATIQSAQGQFLINSDLFLDYNVYSRMPGTRTAYVVEITHDDGSTEEWGPYSNYRSAQLAIFRAVEQGRAGTWQSNRIVERQAPHPWVFMQRFDKLSQAEFMEAQLLSLGLEVDIRTVYAPPRLRDPFDSIQLNNRW